MHLSFDCQPYYKMAARQDPAQIDFLTYIFVQRQGRIESDLYNFLLLLI